MTCVLSAARLAADDYVYYIRELTKMKENHYFIFMAKHERPPSCGEVAPMDVVLCYVS